MAWERVSTQLDLANNADPNKAVVYDLWNNEIVALMMVGNFIARKIN